MTVHTRISCSYYENWRFLTGLGTQKYSCGLTLHVSSVQRWTKREKQQITSYNLLVVYM